jgi:hypothetical protein
MEDGGVLRGGLAGGAEGETETISFAVLAASWQYVKLNTLLAHDLNMS